MQRVAMKPEDLSQCWVDAFNAGDLDGLVALYEPQAAVVDPSSGQVHAGSAAIRSLLGGIIAMHATATASAAYCVSNGDLCLGRVVWSIEGTSTDGEPFSMEGTSSEIYRRQADGGWLYTLDHPTGGA